jgi:molybdopterin converting factor small subunit
MVVSVQFYGTQRALTKTNGIKIPLTENGKVRDVFGYLMDYYPNLPLTEEGVLVTVNNKASNMNQVLNPDDNIIFLPHVGGG